MLPVFIRNKVDSENPHCIRVWGPQCPNLRLRQWGSLTPFSLQGGDAAAGAAKVRSAFWPALQMNWRVWTPVQFINVNYVPIQFRVLFANLVALFWYAYLASLGK